MEAMRKQAMNIYDSSAQTQAMLDEVKSGHDEFARVRQSATAHQEWVEANYNRRREDLENFNGAKEFISDQVNRGFNDGLTKAQQDHLDSNLRALISDPTAFAQRVMQATGQQQVENLASDNNAE